MRHPGTKEYSILKITYLANTSFTTEDGTPNALSLFNADGALRGDAIYIASIEFIK